MRFQKDPKFLFLQTVHSPLFFREIVEIPRVSSLIAAILIFKCTEGAGVRSLFQAFRQCRAVRSKESDEKQRGTGERGAGSFLPRTAPHRDLNAWNRLGRPGLRSPRSYGKIGDCEHSTLFMAKSTRSLGLVFYGDEAHKSSLNTATSIMCLLCFFLTERNACSLFNTK